MPNQTVSRSQVARIMKINQLDSISPDAIEAAREVFVVGTYKTVLTLPAHLRRSLTWGSR